MNGESLSRVELLQMLGDMDSTTGEWMSI